MDKPKYVVVEDNMGIHFYNEEVWDNKKFKRMLNGKEIGRGLTLEEAIVMKQLMESEK